MLQARLMEKPHLLPDTVHPIALVYEVDLQAPALDDFGAFTEFLLISGRSPATVKNYLSAVQILFQNGKLQL